MPWPWQNEQRCWKTLRQEMNEKKVREASFFVERMKMDTEIINLQQRREEGICAGIQCAKQGELFAIPTETVYGLAGNALNEQVIHSIFTTKGRPADNPLIVHVCDVAMAETIADLSKEAYALAEQFWPGPLTLILPAKACIPAVVTAGLSTVAVRMPNQKEVLEIIRQSKIPLAAPSANKSGRPSPTKAEHVLDDFAGEIPLILDGGMCSVGVESTVLLLGERPTILRPGNITQDALQDVIGTVHMDEHILHPMQTNDVIRSPGMKYKHYAPKANVTMVDGANKIEKIKQLYDEKTREGRACVIFSSLQTSDFYQPRNCVILGDNERLVTFSHHFYDALRSADKAKYQEIIMESIPAQAEGLAFMNRALRAASFQVILAK